MVYKKYINRGGKKFGPYYFKSVRDDNGNVKSIYLGTKKPRSNLPTILISLLFILIGLVSFFSLTGLDIAEISEEVVEEEEEVESNDVELESEEIEEETSEVEIEDLPEEEIEISEELNETEEIDDNVELNESEINITEDVELNITEELNESEINITEDIELNITEELNLTDMNISEELNLTLVNMTINITNIVNSTNESLTYYDVIINQPVKWEKRVKLNQDAESISIELPKEADVISILEIEEDIETKLDESEFLIIGETNELYEEEINNIGNLITGNVIKTIENKFNDILKFLDNLFSFTGMVIYEEPEKVEIEISGNVSEVKVEYLMPGPVSNETNINEFRKIVNISSDEHYENILAYTYLDNFPLNSINLYWWNNGTREKSNFDAYDSDDDGLVDYIEWIVPHLSEQQYEIDITILNVQSFPELNGNWTVYFNTTGSADLIIDAYNGTSWSRNWSEGIDLEFLSLECDNNSINYTWSNSELFISNYSCNETGVEISSPHTVGAHTLMFKFGEQVAYAYNDVVLKPSCGDTITETTTLASGLTDCTSVGLNIGANNIVLDCQGNTIDGDNIDDGSIGIQDSGTRNNVTIKNCIVQQFSKGMSIYNEGNYTIFNNSLISNFDDGIYLSLGGDHNVSNNNISGNTGGSGRGLYNYRRLTGTNVFENNIFSANGNYGIRISGEATYGDAENYILRNNSVSDTAGIGYGIALTNSNNHTLVNNTIYDNAVTGIFVGATGTPASNCTIEDNDIYETGSGQTQDQGIYLSSSYGNVIKNNNIYDHTIVTGIRAEGEAITDTIIYNNNLTGNKDGIYLKRSTNINVSGNTIYDNTRYGMLLAYDPNIRGLIEDNDIYDTAGGGTQDYGIYARGYSANELFNFTIKNNRISNHTINSGLYLYNSDATASTTGNNITNNTFFGNKYQLYIKGATNNHFSYNDIKNSTNWAVLIWYDANNNTFLGDKIYDSYYHGIYMYSDSDDNVFDNVSIYHNSQGSSSNYNLYINTNCDRNIFKNSKIYNSSGRGIYLKTTSEGNKFINTVLDEQLSSVDFYVNHGAGYNVTLLNSSYSGLTYVSGNIIKEWYLDAHVNLSNGSDLQNANVTGYDNVPTEIFSELTNSSGRITRQNLTEYIQTGAAAFTYYTNYTINTTESTYGTNSQQVNLTSNAFVNVTYNVNAAPATGSSRISPTTAYTNDTLVGYCNGTDADGGNITYYYRWYKDGVIVKENRLNCVDSSCNRTYIIDDIDSQANEGQDNDGDFDNDEGEFSSGDYANIDEDDNNYVEDASAVGKYQYHRFEISIDELISSITNVVLTWKGYGSTGFAGGHSWWIYQSLGWIEKDSGTQQSKETLTTTYTSSFSNIIQSGIIQAAAQTDATFSHLYSYYAESVISYNPYNAESVEANIKNVSNVDTAKTQNWTFSCLANDGTLNATTWINSSVVVQNSAPDQVVLTSPAAEASLTDRTPTFTWEVPNDNDGDALTYGLEVDNDVDFSSSAISVSPAVNEYNASSDLDVDTTYYWKVRATDGTEYGDWSSVRNFSIASTMILTTVNSSVSFGSVNRNNTYNSSDNSPYPFVIQNDGNVLVNISLNATQLFSSVGLGNSAYQCKIDNTAEASSFNWAGSLTSWTNIPTGAISAIDSLKYENDTDSAEIDILISVPSDEVAGAKSSIMTFITSLAE